MHFYMPDEGPAYYGMTCAVRPFFNIWHSSRVTTCRINFNFTDIMHLVRPIHDTGNGPCSSLNMRILTQLLIFTKFYFSDRLTHFLAAFIKKAAFMR